MDPASLAWKPLPPVGGEPANVRHDMGHLTYRGRPALVAIGQHVLLWGGTNNYGEPLPSALGLTIDEGGHVVGHWEVDWSRGDRAALIENQVVVVGPGRGPTERAVVFPPGDPGAAQQFASPIASRTGVDPTVGGRAVVVWGGAVNDRLKYDSFPPFDDGAVFDAGTRQWSVLPPAPLCGRKGHVIQAVGDQVVVWGGWTWTDPRTSRPLADGAVYDLRSNDWRPMPPSPLSARTHTSFAAVDGRVFIWSGSGGGSGYPSDGALFDPRDDSWALLPKAPVRQPHAFTFAVDDLVLLTGGTYAGGRTAGLFVYSASTGSWAVPDVPGFAGPASFARLDNGELYVWSAHNAQTEHALLQSAPPSGSGSTAVPLVDTHPAPVPGARSSQVEVDPGLLDYMAESSGAVHLQLRGAHDPDTAVAAMRRAGAAVSSLPHPEEPDDPLPSFVSAVTLADQGPTFWFDIADAEAYDGVLDQVLTVIVSALEEAGASGRLTKPDLPDSAARS